MVLSYYGMVLNPTCFDPVHVDGLSYVSMSYVINNTMYSITTNGSYPTENAHTLCTRYNYKPL